MESWFYCLAFLSYKYFDANKDYKKYKSRYKELSILYLNEIMEPPKLEAPSPQDMKITNIDFNTNVLQFSNLDGNIFSIQDFKGKIFLLTIGLHGVILA